jgi:hypothetical protein
VVRECFADKIKMTGMRSVNKAVSDPIVKGRSLELLSAPIYNAGQYPKQQSRAHFYGPSQRLLQLAPPCASQPHSWSAN